jgi:hypothetical protein
MCDNCRIFKGLREIMKEKTGRRENEGEWK